MKKFNFDIAFPRLFSIVNEDEGVLINHSLFLIQIRPHEHFAYPDDYISYLKSKNSSFTININDVKTYSYKFYLDLYLVKIRCRFVLESKAWKHFEKDYKKISDLNSIKS